MMDDDTSQLTDIPGQPQPLPIKPNVQDRFLSMLCREQISVYIYLVNGIKLHGSIKSFDQTVICLNGPVGQIIYKTAICSVLPVQDARMADRGENRISTTATDKYDKDM